MKYDWVKKVQEGKVGNRVQVRMMSTGNDLACGYLPKYGIYLVNQGDKDPMDLSHTAFTSLGGGFIRTADIEFIIKEDPKDPLLGYIIERDERDNAYALPSTEIVGYCAILTAPVTRVAQ